MHIGVPAETRAGETRGAATPETVKKLVTQEHRISVQIGAGLPASYIDDAFAQAGADLVNASTRSTRRSSSRSRRPPNPNWPCSNRAPCS